MCFLIARLYCLFTNISCKIKHRIMAKQVRGSMRHSRLSLHHHYYHRHNLNFFTHSYGSNKPNHKQIKTIRMNRHRLYEQTFKIHFQNIKHTRLGFVRDEISSQSVSKMGFLSCDTYICIVDLCHIDAYIFNRLNVDIFLIE